MSSRQRRTTYETTLRSAPGAISITLGGLPPSPLPPPGGWGGEAAAWELQPQGTCHTPNIATTANDARPRKQDSRPAQLVCLLPPLLSAPPPFHVTTQSSQP